MSHRLTLLLAYLAFVVYGSLVPLDFRPLPWAQAWAQFQAIPFLELGVASRADWIANGVLYLPLGLLAAQVLAAPLGRWLGAPVAWALCAAVAVGVEFAQQFFPPRTVSQNDLMAEGIGAAIGVALAPWVQSWARRLAAQARQHAMLWLLGSLQVYAVLYLALAFFPYDLLLTAQEWRDKLAGGNLAWTWVADRGPGLALLRLAVEAALVLPLGVLLASVAGWAHWRALWLGMAAGGLLGLAIEAGQLVLASGVSQGASMLARALGVGLGAALAVPLVILRLATVRGPIARWGAVALGPYLLLMLFASGWMRAAWHGLEPALATLERVRWVPFYYHYYTTEAVALYSLGVVTLMYAPLAALAWARAWRAGPTVLALLLLALAVEAGKLFVPGQRPDPTNLLIAVATAWLVWHGLQALAALTAPAVPTGERPTAAALPPLPAAHPTGPKGAAAATERSRPPGAPMGSLPAALWALLCVGAVALGLAALPAVVLPLAGLLLAAGAAVWWRPSLAVVIVLAGLPLLDLTPWTGPRWWNEFDLLLLLCLGLAAVRLAQPGSTPVPAAVPAVSGSAATALFGPWALSLCGAAGLTLAAVGLAAWPADTAWHSGWAALSLLKSAAWAWAFVALLRGLERAGTDWVALVASGMQLGLAGVVLWVLWERQIFVGLTDFAAEYRVTGPFSAMHRGGAFIECYLATASAFAVHGLWRARHVAARLASLLLLAAAAYAVMVTYSRNGYAALALVLPLAVAAAARAAGPRVGAGTLRLGAWGLLGVLAAAGMATAVLAAGGFARERLTASWSDLQVRQAHWQDAIAMRSPGLGPALVGEGLGRFPELHFWRSAEPVRAASFQRLTEAEGTFLRLGPGATLYLEQVLRLPGDGPLVLEADLRGRGPAPALHVALCEKSTLTSRRCVAGQAAAPTGAEAERWHRVRLELATAQLDAPPPPLGPQTKFSLLSPRGETTLDVARLRLLTPEGRDLLANGDFSRGTQRWMWSTDVHPPWHVDNLPVHVWLEQGWLGAAAWAWLLLGALAAGAVAVWHGCARLPVAVAALAGFVASATLNTLVDEPRFLWLLLLYAWWALQRTPPRPAFGAPT